MACGFRVPSVPIPALADALETCVPQKCHRHLSCLAGGETALSCLLLCRREFAEAASPRGLGGGSRFETSLTAGRAAPLSGH